jgi:hypothetical protein
MLQHYAPFGVSIWQVISHNPFEIVITILGAKIGLDKMIIALIIAFIL